MAAYEKVTSLVVLYRTELSYLTAKHFICIDSIRILIIAKTSLCVQSHCAVFIMKYKTKHTYVVILANFRVILAILLFRVSSYSSLKTCSCSLSKKVFIDAATQSCRPRLNDSITQVPLWLPCWWVLRPLLRSNSYR